MADELLLIGQAQPAGGSAGRNDQGAGFQPFALHIEAEGAGGKIGIEHGAVQEFGAEILRLLLHVFHQVRAVDAFRKTGEIFHQGGERELAAGLMPAHDQGLEIGAGGINGGRVTGTPGADDDDVTHDWRAEQQGSTQRAGLER